MLCPRCGKEIDDTETLCPHCMQEINRSVEFNDFRKDGFVQIQSKDGSDTDEPVGITPRYFKIAELNIFVIAVVYILLISVFTVFSLRFVQKTKITYVEPYKIQPTTVATPDETEPETETEKNDVKSYSVKDVYGSWCLEADKDKTDAPIQYYTFDKSGVLQENYGSIVSTGRFSDLSDDEDKRLYINLSSTFKGTYIFELTGNKKSGYVLSLYDERANSAYRFVKAKAKAWKVTPPKKPKLDKNLIGKWYTKDKVKAYILTSKGSFKRITGNMSTKGAWSVDSKGKLTVKYIREALIKRNVPYKTTDKKNVIIINGTTYYKS